MVNERGQPGVTVRVRGEPAALGTGSESRALLGLCAVHL